MMADMVNERRMVTTIGPGGERRRADPLAPWYEEVTGPGGGRWRRYGDSWVKWVLGDPAKGYPPGWGWWSGPADPPSFPRQLELPLEGVK